MTEPADLLARAWAHLGAAASGAAPGLVTFASWGPEGPQMRSVVLRAADPEAATLAFYTDAFATKVAEITADPRAGLHLWDRTAALQIRATGLARVTPGPAEVWAEMPPDQRRNYGVTPPPGRAIAAPDAYDRVPDPAAFAVVTLTLSGLDIVSLREPHMRAGFARHDDWRGQWLSP